MNNYKEGNRKLENKYFYDPITEEHPCWGMESIACDLPMENLFNTSRPESATYIDLKNRQIVAFNGDEEPTQGCIRIPDLEWLAPYNDILHEFLDDIDVPEGITASQYLKKTGRYCEFCNYRIQKAKTALDTRLAAFGLRIVIKG